VRVLGLWRYPVKSMQGEHVDSVLLTPAGVAGDRGYGVLDLGSGTVISAKRDGRLLHARARMAGDALVVEVPGVGELPPGDALDAALTRWLARPVRLVAADAGRAAVYEASADPESDDTEPVRWTGVPGSFVDSRSLHLLAAADLERLAAERPELAWDVRRFRPNIVLDAGTALVPGARLRAGGAVVEVRTPCPRCVMTTRPQPGGLERELEVLRHLAATRGADLGVLAEVAEAGSVCAGDAVDLVP